MALLSSALTDISVRSTPFAVPVVEGAGVVSVPLPVLPLVTGLQIELLRGVMLAGLGLAAIRSARTAAAAPTPVPVAS